MSTFGYDNTQCIPVRRVRIRSQDVWHAYILLGEVRAGGGGVQRCVSVRLAEKWVSHACTAGAFHSSSSVGKFVSKTSTFAHKGVRLSSYREKLDATRILSVCAILPPASRHTVHVSSPCRGRRTLPTRRIAGVVALLGVIHPWPRVQNKLNATTHSMEPNDRLIRRPSPTPNRNGE